MALFGSRISQAPPRLVGRTYNDAVQELEEFLQVLYQFSDDVNSLGEPPTPSDVALGGASAPGAGPVPAYGDHVHALAAGSPVALGDALADGTSDEAARADHVHALAVRIALAASVVATRRVLNFIQGAGLSLTVADNGGGDRVDVTIAVAAPVVLSPAQLVATTNDYAPGVASVYRLSTDASRDLTGLVAGISGTSRVIVNVGANPLVLKNQDIGSVAANRFLSVTAADITLAADEIATILYDATTARWRASKP